MSFVHQRVRAEEDSAHIPLPPWAVVGGSDDTGRPDDTVVESISDDGMGVENDSSSSPSSASTPSLSAASDIAPQAVLPPPSIEDQLSFVRVLLESSSETKPGQTRFLVAKRCV